MNGAEALLQAQSDWGRLVYFDAGWRSVRLTIFRWMRGRGGTLSGLRCDGPEDCLADEHWAGGQQQRRDDIRSMSSGFEKRFRVSVD
ncbi:MAG: hypothetical protein BGN83_07700 [Rhizobium sp. 63-7]|nr:MAG: hypothetical protein BGN83_07700 [Rhizobium sp. 63-7]